MTRDAQSPDASPRRIPRQSLAASVVGSFSEAWAEVRIHRTRVLLSLIGVAVAVAALTSVVGLGSIAEQSLREQNERYGGRPAMVVVSAYSNDGSPVDTSSVGDAFDEAMERYRVRYHSEVLNGQQRIGFTRGSAEVAVLAVDVDYRTMYRIDVLRGSWFTPEDENHLAPSVLVNTNVWKRLGSPDLRTHPTVTLSGGSKETTAVVIGVARMPNLGPGPGIIMLSSAYRATADPEIVSQSQSSFSAWVPPGAAGGISTALRREVAAAAPSGVQFDVSRQDYESFEGPDPLKPIKLVVGGVAVLVLFLGALGLVNISLVTVRQRIREIGIRRSVGATAGRVFFAVMMESVVATLAAGIVGVGVSIALVENPFVQSKISQGVAELPGFPVSAALIGLAAATAVGALAGLLPAIVAVRVKVIDAIRY
jgi:putative ABC transport system permease protein